MNHEASRRIDFAIADRSMTDAERFLLRHVQVQVDRQQLFASAIFAALEAGDDAQRASIKLAQPELFAVWDEFRGDGLSRLLVPDLAASLRGVQR